MTLRPCLDCGRPSHLARCPLHQQIRDRTRDAATRLGARLIAERPWCADCGTTKDLTVDHIVALAHGGTNDPSNLRVLCRRHNSQRGSRISGSTGGRGRQ
jgi:5-methylcytosine-specific restriction endonuclease McrA